ncbi:protein EVI2B [Melospiza georgiana]|uniref:protein EVI2B n=1 Tax=Melospiza georgiana TaxID=44398 RepID=UPI0025AB6AF9|nr:protein EVI2B [Melospiza georgiana]
MARHQVMLAVFCGEIWSSLSAAAPQHAARTESHMCPSATSPRADSLLLHHLQATVPSLQQAATEPQAFPGEEEAGDGSWVAALILGSILIGMALAITVILLWKCCLRPPQAQSHWAGRSPFADGDTSDLCMEPDPGTKRSSVLFMLPWRLKQGTNLQEDPTVQENPPQHTCSAENGQPPPPAAGCSGASSGPAPEQEPANTAAECCPPPDPPPECSDLPPPPDWLREPAEEPSSDPSKHSALHLEAEEPQPSPPEPLIQEIHETLPQPEHPL